MEDRIAGGWKRGGVGSAVPSSFPFPGCVRGAQAQVSVICATAAQLSRL